jgi:hypothetical protein
MNGIAVLTLALGIQAAPGSSLPPLLSTVPTPAGMPTDPAQMSGMPLQVGDLPPGTVAIRVIRQSFANNLVGLPVELQVLGVDGLMLEEKTDPSGRATFTGIAVGGTVFARATVDGERLTSQEFEMPARGGVRLVLVAGGGAGVSSSTPVESAIAPTPVVSSTHAAAVDPTLWVPSILGLVTIALGIWWGRRLAAPSTQGAEESQSSR